MTDEVSPDAMTSEYAAPEAPEAELPRAVGSEVDSAPVACPTCGTPLTRNVAKSGAISLSTCPTCYPSTTAGEGDLPRTNG